MPARSEIFCIYYYEQFWVQLIGIAFPFVVTRLSRVNLPGVYAISVELKAKKL
jgi:hypothetical protein